MPSKKFLRPIAGLAVLGCASLTLAGCGSSAKSTKDAGSVVNNKSASYSGTCDDVKPGSTSASVNVTGAFGKTTTKATFKKPLKATSLQRTITKLGSGAPVKKGQTVNAEVTVYLGSGKKIATQPLTLAVGSASIPKAFTAGTACFPLGTRSVVTDSAKDVYGGPNTQAGIKATDSLVIVTDLVSVKKPLVPSKWTKGVPSVSLGKGGKPTIKLKGTAPSTLQIDTLKKGTGATIKSGDQVTLNYQGISWKTKKIFQQTFGQQPATFGTDQVVEGFGAALVGQKVGTRLVVSIPSKYAYPAGTSSPQAGQDLVFYIEIDKVKAAS